MVVQKNGKEVTHTARDSSGVARPRARCRRRAEAAVAANLLEKPRPSETPLPAFVAAGSANTRPKRCYSPMAVTASAKRRRLAHQSEALRDRDFMQAWRLRRQWQPMAMMAEVPASDRIAALRERVAARARL